MVMIAHRQKTVGSPISKKDSCENLRDQFLAAIQKERGSAYDWHTVWRTVVEHPWYRAELITAARIAVKRVGRPGCSRQDVEQEAMLLLAEKLQRNPGLGIDSERSRDSFGGWMGRIIQNDCRMAVRTLRRLNRGEPLSVEPPVSGNQSEREWRIDLSLEIEKLPDPSRTVLLLSMKGLSLKEIAGRLDRSYWQTWRAHQDGISRLRRVFWTGD